MAVYNQPRKKLSITLEYPQLDSFLYYVQLLLLEEIKEAERLAELGTNSSLSELGKYNYRFTRSYQLPYRHVIYAFETLGEIEEPDQKDLAEQFDELGFEIYISRALVKVNNDVSRLLRNLEAKLVTSKALELIKTRFFKVVEVSNSLDKEVRKRLLRR